MVVYAGNHRETESTKWMLIVDCNDLPLGFHQAGATTAEVTLAEATLDSTSVPPPAMTSQTAARKVGSRPWICDCGYGGYMIVVRSVTRCGAVAFGCAFRPNDDPRPDKSSGDARWWRAKTTTGSAIRWRAPSRG